MKSFEYYLGKACRKFRNETLHISARLMLEQAGLNISRSRISNFENGHTHSTKLLPVYYNAGRLANQTDTLDTLIKEAIDEYAAELETHCVDTPKVEQA